MHLLVFGVIYKLTPHAIHTNAHVAVPGRIEHYSVAYFDHIAAFEAL